MQKIGFLVKKRLRISKLNQKIVNYQILGMWESVLTCIFPETSGTTKAISLDHGVLKVASLSKETADKVIFFRHRIINDLNGRVGAQAVFKIVCEH